jgi:hypothetical protein
MQGVSNPKRCSIIKPKLELEAFSNNRFHIENFFPFPIRYFLFCTENTTNQLSNLEYASIIISYFSVWIDFNNLKYSHCFYDVFFKVLNYWNNTSLQNSNCRFVYHIINLRFWIAFPYCRIVESLLKHLQSFFVELFFILGKFDKIKFYFK